MAKNGMSDICPHCGSALNAAEQPAPARERKASVLAKRVIKWGSSYMAHSEGGYYWQDKQSRAYVFVHCANVRIVRLVPAKSERGGKP